MPRQYCYLQSTLPYHTAHEDAVIMIISQDIDITINPMNLGQIKENLHNYDVIKA